MLFSSLSQCVCDLHPAKILIFCLWHFVTGCVYAVGGHDRRKTLNSAERFDWREGRWHHIPPMKTTRRWLSAAAANGDVYAIGMSDECCFYQSWRFVISICLNWYSRHKAVGGVEIEAEL